MYRFEPTKEMTFQPSHLSAADLGFEPITMAIIAGATLTAGAIQGAQAKKAQKEADPAGTTFYYKDKYMACKEKREAKGKKAYPEDSSTSIFVTNCHSEYNKWKEWEAKSGATEEAPQMEAPKDKGAPGKPVGYTVPILLGSGLLLTFGVGYYAFFVRRSGPRRQQSGPERPELS